MSQARLIDRFPAGVVTLPPSKSLSHRAVICAALAARQGGTSRLYQVGNSQDIAVTRQCMTQLGCTIQPQEDALLVSPGPRQEGVLDCGESGSTLRFLIPLAALGEQRVTLTGRGRLLQRPLDIYRDLFAETPVHFAQSEGQVEVQGPLQGGGYALAGNVSSQFISGLLLALPLCHEDSTLTLTQALESRDYVKMTVDVMSQFGVQVDWRADDSFFIPGGQTYRPCDYRVEGDYSQAAFFLAAGALGRPVQCAGLARHSLQGDSAIVKVLEQMHIPLHRQDGKLWAGAGPFQAATIDVREIPDLVPPLAALCSFAQGTSRIINAGRLRIKESDRLDALCTELGKLGAKISQTEDSLIIEGQPRLTGGKADAQGDHRIAMAVAVAAIGCTGPVELTGWENVNKSYPDFWIDFEKEARHG